MGENTEANPPHTSPGEQAAGWWVGCAFAGASLYLSKKQLGLSQHQELCALREGPVQAEMWRSGTGFSDFSLL